MSNDLDKLLRRLNLAFPGWKPGFTYVVPQPAKFGRLPPETWDISDPHRDPHCQRDERVVTFRCRETGARHELRYTL